MRWHRETSAKTDTRIALLAARIEAPDGRRDHSNNSSEIRFARTPKRTSQNVRNATFGATYSKNSNYTITQTSSDNEIENALKSASANAASPAKQHQHIDRKKHSTVGLRKIWSLAGEPANR